jgi:hypothetical protein
MWSTLAVNSVSQARLVYRGVDTGLNVQLGATHTILIMLQISVALELVCATLFKQSARDVNVRK